MDSSPVLRWWHRPLHLPARLVDGRIAGKIIAPYILLITMLALLAIYLVTRVVTSSLEERFLARLLDSGKAANETMVKLERDQLQALRLMINTQGTAEAIAAGDVSKLQELLLPLQVNARLDLVDVVLRDGSPLLLLRSDDLGADAAKLTDPTIGASQMALRVLSGQVDALGSYYTDLVPLSWGVGLYSAGPVLVDDQIVGAVLVGTTLDRAVQGVARDAQSSLTVYGLDGTVMTTTLPLLELVGNTATGRTSQQLSVLEISPAIATRSVSGNPVIESRPLQLGTRTYRELVGALEVRTRPVAPLGVALRVTAVQDAAFASRSQLTALFSVVVLGVVAFGFLLARAITRPLTALVRATERVSLGELDGEVRVTTRDETGRLTTSFNQMVAGLRERERIRNMFSQYVTNQVADAVLRGEIKLGGESKVVTILLTDVRSFTTLSETMSPEDLVTMLNRYFDLMIDAILEFDGTLDKFIGDGILVEYNAPLSVDHHALRGVLTALRMRENLIAYNEDQVRRGDQTIRMGMGIHTGRAVVGNIGSEGKKVEYTAMGDTVNVASRLEGQTKELYTDALISAESYAQVKSWIEVSESYSLQVKGRAEPVVAHKLIGLKPGLPLSIELLNMINAGTVESPPDIDEPAPPEASVPAAPVGAGAGSGAYTNGATHSPAPTSVMGTNGASEANGATGGADTGSGNGIAAGVRASVGEGVAAGSTNGSPPHE